MTARGARPDGERLVFPVRLRRLQRIGLLRSVVEHGPAAAVLVPAGLQGLGGSGLDRVLSVVQLAVCVWILALLLREVRHVVAAAHDDSTPITPLADGALPPELEGVDWPGVAAALLLTLEGWHRWHETGHVARPLALTAVFTLAIALGGRRVIARRVQARIGPRAARLAISRDGFEYQGSRRHRFAARWAEVAGIEASGDAVHLRLHDGRQFALRAQDHVRGTALVAAARDAIRRTAPAHLAGPSAP